MSSQNYGAKDFERIKRGVNGAVLISVIFSLIISVCVFIFAEPLMKIFIDGSEVKAVTEGVDYLRIEGTFYFMIGILFLLYGYYRAMGKPGMSFILTVVSLGTRVVLAYTLSDISAIGVLGIWWSVPIGWFLADVLGIGYYLLKEKKCYDV